uniref:Caspase family p20 domain-containing protein n=1 Tax=Pinctada fucata TaxID=50426 RepID=A0A194ANE2_PINFU
MFKGDRCPTLVLKPKIFIIQTADRALEKDDGAEHGDGDGATPIIRKIPVEADLFIYHSMFSDEYTEDLLSVNKDKYNELVREGLVADPITNDSPASYFIYTLHKAINNATRNQKLDINDWIFSTNDIIKSFIKGGMWQVSGGSEVWSVTPTIPVSCSQLTKKLVFNVH